MNIIGETRTVTKEEAKALRKQGWLVLSLAKLGDGVPDLLISRQGVLRLVEVKGTRGTLTEDQLNFMRAGWHFDVVRGDEDIAMLTNGAKQAVS